MIKLISFFWLVIISTACNQTDNTNTVDQKIEIVTTDTGSTLIPEQPPRNITPLLLNKDINSINGHELATYAKTLVGIPYRYASIDSSQGFDCSGFITFVFNHFQIAVPRSSVDFTNVGEEVDERSAREGDLILFTGTADSVRIVGHMGIITDNTDTLRFIHSTSGKANGVTISALTEHYKKRFVKVMRVFGEK